MENLYLIGFMGAGKSTVAKVFQKQYQMQLIEMDEEIVRRENRTISEIFAVEGEVYFRNLETELIRDIQKKSDQIISCGGGAVLRAENVAMMKENGIIVLLTAAPETILERVKGNQDRPLLNGNMNIEYISGLMEKRRAVYETAADVFIATDGKTAIEICGEIMDKLKG